MSALLKLAMKKAYGQGKSKSAARRRKESEVVALHTPRKGQVIEMVGGGIYDVAADGSLRRRKAA